MSINYQGSGGGVPRKTAKIFAKDVASNDMTVFGSTLAGNTVYSQDLDSIQSSHYEVGWREGVISDLNYPLMSDMNAVQHTFSQQIAYILQHGIPEWDAGTTYYTRDLVASGGVIYTSLIDSNTNNSISDTTKWAVYYNPAEFDNYANKSLSNLNATGEKHFVNKSQVTNCILEAPNGVFTASGATLTVKSGLKVLIPNGRNANGTLNNNEFTLNADATYTYSFGQPLINDYIYVRADSIVDRMNGNFVYYVTNVSQLDNLTGTNNYRLAYVENDNFWYYTDPYVTEQQAQLNGYIDATHNKYWIRLGIALIGKLSVSNNNTIYDLRPDYELSLSNSSLTSKTIINTPLALPSNWLYINLTWSEASEIDLIAPANGYFELYRAAAADTDFICFTQVLSDGVTPGISTVSSSSRIDEAIGLVYLHINLPVQKGTLVKLTKRGVGAVNAFRFVYAKGDE